MSLAWLVLLLPAAPQAPVDTAVVCPTEFREALAPWLALRRAQGHELALVDNRGSAADIRGDIRKLAAQGALRHIVLVGDADPAMENNRAVRARCVPAHQATAKVNIRWGSEPLIATDNWYADLDDDRIPDVAIGRLTADTPRELTTIVQKIIDYEQTRNFDLWRRRVDFVAGMGGFGKLADATLEIAAKKFITDGIPAGYSTSMTYGSWCSPYCPDPRDFRSAVIDRLNAGSLFWVYLGHGRERMVDHVHVPGANYPILSTADLSKVRCQCGSPIACFLACYTAAYDHADDCLAEEMLRSPGAPVAILGGTRVTMPYAMAVMGTELLQQCFVEHKATLGEAILAAKRNMMRPAEKNANRTLLDALAAAFSPAPVDLPAELAEHLDLFNLIGDPLLRLRYPKSVELEVAEQATAGTTLQVRGVCPVAGGATIELITRRDRLTFTPPMRDQYDSTPAVLTEFNQVYQRANDPRWHQVESQVAGGQFQANLPIPSAAHGPCHVRVYVQGRDDFALGCADVVIRRPQTAAH